MFVTLTYFSHQNKNFKSQPDICQQGPNILTTATATATATTTIVYNPFKYKNSIIPNINI